MHSQLPDVIIDVTHQRHTELLLEASERRFRHIMDGSIEGILIHRDAKAIFVNKAFVNMLGYASYHEIMALDSISLLIAPHDRERVVGYDRSRLKGEFAPEIYEFNVLHCDGSMRCVELKSSIIDWQRKPALLSTVFDITQRKLMQQEVAQLRKALAHRGRLSMLGEMAAGIAHELNQPLTAIASRCGAIKRRIGSDKPDLVKISAALESIETQALRSGEIIKQMRALVEAKNQQHQAIDIAGLLDTCLNFINSEGLVKRVVIATDIAAQLPQVSGDPIQIQQVVLNLIRNAGDAMRHLKPAHRHLMVSAMQHDDRYVQISISDSGHGISRQREAHLFESFFTTKDEGMGMGLSICRKIVEAHHGKIWFSRNAEQGVTFHFTLPLFMSL